MTKTPLLALMAVLVVPFAYAHDPPGTPKNYCEPQSDWAVHDYGAPATGLFILGNEDGNLAGDCDGVVTADPGVPCVGVDPADPVNSLFVGLCDSDINPPVADWDGHNEFALGGAWLLAGWAALDCFGAEPHHAEFGRYSVEDLVLGAGASFSVAADNVDATGQAGACGDFESDASQDCIGSCDVSIPVGLDGSYQVFVTGTRGHILALSLREDTFGIPGAAAVTLHYTHQTGAVNAIPSPGWVCGGVAGDPASDVAVSCYPSSLPQPVYCQNPAVVAQRLGGGDVLGRTQCMSMEPTCVAQTIPCQNIVWGTEQITYSLVCRAYLFPNNEPLAGDWTVECYNDP